MARWRRLIDRAQAAGIEAMALSPTLGDFNEDLRHLGIDALRAALRVQLAPEDVARFLSMAVWTGTGDDELRASRSDRAHRSRGASPCRRGPRPRPS